MEHRIRNTKIMLTIRQKINNKWISITFIHIDKKYDRILTIKYMGNIEIVNNIIESLIGCRKEVKK